MVSIGPTFESRNYTFMYNLPDINYNDNYNDKYNTKTYTSTKKMINKPISHGNTILDFLYKNSNMFSGFLHIVQIAEMEPFLQSPKFRKTVFIPSDEYLDLEEVRKISQGTAKCILKYSMLSRIINKQLLKLSPSYYLITDYKPCPRLPVYNISDITTLDDTTKIMQFDIHVSNGLIHIVDRILVPSVLI